MRLAEYSDDELIEEVKHRGLKVEIEALNVGFVDSSYKVPFFSVAAIKIGGVVFDLRT